MPTIIETPVFAYDELDEAAKARAREWYLEGGLDYDWWDFVYDDFASIAKLLGLDLDRKGGSRTPAIWFSGFSSQGDGACFEGVWTYAPGMVRAATNYAPQDQALHGIAARLARLQRRHFYQLRAQIAHRGRYYHEHSMSIDVTDNRTGSCPAADVEKAVSEEMRNLARWLYSKLEDEYEYLTSDEAVAEAIRANEYTFEKDGRPFR